MRRQRAAWGRRVEGPCRGRGFKTPEGVALRVPVQPVLPVCGANLAVGLASPPQVVEGLEPVVYRGGDRRLELQVGGERHRRPQPRLRHPGVVLRADVEHEGVVFALSQRHDDHSGAFRYADHGLGPRQAFGVADGYMRVRRPEHADHQLRVLLSSLRHRKGGCRAGMHDWPRVEVRDIRGPDGVALPRGPQMFFLVRTPDQCGGVGPPRLLMVCSRTASGQGSAVT